MSHVEDYNDVEKSIEEKGLAETSIASANDAEQAGSYGTVHRNLKSRHIQMIALGGTIGTGLFVGSGGAYATGGPLGILLAYSIMGAVVYSMMVALGEMTTLFPVTGAFTHYASRFVDPALGFALGWNYWYSYAITLPTELTAAAIVLDYWPGAQNISVAVWITIFLIAVCSFNFLGVRYYGEAEFWFSVTKILTIMILILLGVIISAGGGPNREAIGFRYWAVPFQQFVTGDGLTTLDGAFGRFMAFWTVFVQAAFSFLGTEIVALTASEAENPRRNVPKAIRRVFFRILLFYVFGVFVIGITVDPNNPDLLSNSTGVTLAASPWVIAIETAGIAVLPSIVNAVVLISAFSAGNSDLYAASRTVYGLACDGKAPAILRKCTKDGVPVWSLVLTASLGLLAYLNVSERGTVVFNWLYNLSAITGLVSWSCILGTYLRFYYGAKVQGIDRDTFPYKAPFQPYASWFGFVFVNMVIIFNSWYIFLDGQYTPTGFLIGYITLPIFAACYIFWKLYHKTRLVPLASLDFETGRRELEELAISEEAKYQRPTTLHMKIWAMIM